MVLAVPTSGPGVPALLPAWHPTVVRAGGWIWGSPGHSCQDCSKERSLHSEVSFRPRSTGYIPYLMSTRESLTWLDFSRQLCFGSGAVGVIVTGGCPPAYGVGSWRVQQAQPIRSMLSVLWLGGRPVDTWRGSGTCLRPGRQRWHKLRSAPFPIPLGNRGPGVTERGWRSEGRVGKRLGQCSADWFHLDL